MTDSILPNLYCFRENKIKSLNMGTGLRIGLPNRVFSAYDGNLDTNTECLF